MASSITSHASGPPDCRDRGLDTVVSRRQEPGGGDPAGKKRTIHPTARARSSTEGRAPSEQLPLSEAGETASADDHVIEDGDAENLPGRHETAGDGEIVFARRRVAGGMIVR